MVQENSGSPILGRNMAGLGELTDKKLMLLETLWPKLTASLLTWSQPFNGHKRMFTTTRTTIFMTALSTSLKSRDGMSPSLLPRLKPKRMVESLSGLPRDTRTGRLCTTLTSCGLTLPLASMVAILVTSTQFHSSQPLKDSAGALRLTKIESRFVWHSTLSLETVKH